MRGVSLRMSCAVLAGAAVWFACSAAVASDRTFDIGYLQLNNDPRYLPARTDARYPLQPWGRPQGAAQVAIDESRFAAQSLGLQFKLIAVGGDDNAALLQAARKLVDSGVHYALADVPADTLLALQAVAGMTLLNVSATADRLRGEACAANVLHVIPSERQRSDAVAQLLLSRHWRKVLVLQGPKPADKLLGQAFGQSAKRFGLKVVATRPFELGNDPRRREFNDVGLLTSGEDYDVVYVADSDGEFAQQVPYRTQLPRPVVGSGGLTPRAWHWAWARYGAPQLNHRLERALGRRANGYDWAAWFAVKALVEAVQRSGATDRKNVDAYLRSDKISLDGFKGARLGFRPWDNQLRQPILLSSGNWVIATAPLDGFVDPRNNLDTLGTDRRESACHAIHEGEDQ